MPFFSVIIPLYNKEKYIKKTLETVFRQTFTDFELIVVNDGSSDDSLQVVSQFDDKRIVLLNKENGGVSSARNVGISSSKGEWICFLDADDELYSDALEHYHKLIVEHSEAKIVAAGCDQTNKKYPQSDKVSWIRDYDKEEAIMVAKTGMAVLNSDCICVKRECFDTVGVFNENYTHGEDIDMWFRLSLQYPILKSEKAIALYVTDYTDNSSHALIKKRAPRGSLLTKRSELKTLSQKQYLGSVAFYYIVINKKNIKNTLRVLVRYFDCVLLFGWLLIKYRLLKLG